NQALQSGQLDAISQSEPQSSQAIRQGYAVELVKPYDTPLEEPVRALVMTEKLYANRDVALRTMKCFVEATKEFIDNPQEAEKYVREKMFRGQLTAEEYKDALENAAFTYDISAGELPRDAAATLLRVAVGFAIGAGLALPLGLWMGARDRVYEVFNPLVQLLRPIPPIAYIPLAILWFGLGNPPAFFLISLGSFFPVLMNTIAGVRNVDAIYVRAAQNLGAPGRTLFWRVLFPAAMPSILAGMRVGVGVAFIVVIVAEMIAVNSGLGYRILEAREYFWSDKILAGMISIGVIA